MFLHVDMCKHTHTHKQRIHTYVYKGISYKNKIIFTDQCSLRAVDIHRYCFFLSGKLMQHNLPLILDN